MSHPSTPLPSPRRRPPAPRPAVHRSRSGLAMAARAVRLAVAPRPEPRHRTPAPILDRRARLLRPQPTRVRVLAAPARTAPADECLDLTQVPGLRETLVAEEARGRVPRRALVGLVLIFLGLAVAVVAAVVTTTSQIIPMGLILIAVALELAGAVALELAGALGLWLPPNAPADADGDGAGGTCGPVVPLSSLLDHGSATTPDGGAAA